MNNINLIVDYSAKISKNGLEIDSLESFEKEIKEAHRRGQRNVRVILIEDNYTVNQKMSKYYYGILLKHRVYAYEDAGVFKSKKDCDKELREKYLFNESFLFDTISKKQLKEFKDVSDLEFSKFIEKCIIDTAENLNYEIPFPSENKVDINLNFNR